MDNIVVNARPKFDMAEKVRALGYRVRDQMEVRILFGDAQIDNKLFMEGNYDFHSP